MANNIAFQPMGKTFKVTANTAAVSANVSSDSPVAQYQIVNASTTDVAYVRITPSGGNAAIPSANAEYGIAVLPASMMIITGPQCRSGANVVVSAISAANTPAIFVTPGEGL
jgi:hypothetical protein